MREKPLLAAGMAMPFAYALTLAAAALTHPQIDLATHLPSEFGRRGVPLAFILNIGLIATGLLGLAGAAGLALAPRRLARRGLTLQAAALALAAPSLAFLVNGFAPLPNPLHYAFNITLAWALLPLLAAVALWRLGSPMWPMLAVITAAEAAMAALIFLTPVVTHLNKGWWMLGVAAVLFDAAFAVCLAVRRLLRAPAAA